MSLSFRIFISNSIANNSSAIAVLDELKPDKKTSPNDKIYALHRMRLFR